MFELKVSVAVPEPPGILVGLIARVSPVVLVGERDIVPEKWFNGVMVMTAEPVLPALTTTLAKEGKKFGISVNALGPGVILTQSNVDSMKPTAEDIRNKWVSRQLPHV